MADWIASPLVGISQIFVVESAISGAIILAGIAVYSRECAAHTLLGSSIGIATGYVLGADPSALTAVRVIFVRQAQGVFLSENCHGRACGVSIQP